MKNRVISKNVMAWVVALALLLSAGIMLLFSSVNNSNVNERVYAADWQGATSGTCGTNVNWRYEVIGGVGTFTIDGIGTTMTDYNGSRPWSASDSNLGLIRKVIVAGSVQHVGNNAFSGCANLTDVELSDNVVSIGDDAFGGCRNLENLSLGSGLRTIGRGAFGMSGNRANNKLQMVTLNDNITEIGDLAFAHCTALKTIKCNTTDPNDVVTLPSNNSFNTIAESLFEGCSSIEKVVFSSNVSTIDCSAFMYCTTLKNVNGGSTDGLCVIPASVEFIDWLAFYDCPLLTSIVIEGASVALGYDFDEFSSYPFFQDDESCETEEEIYTSNSYHIYIPNHENYTSYSNNDGDSWTKYFSVQGLVVDGAPAVGYPVNNGGSSGGSENTGVVADVLIPSLSAVCLVVAIVFVSKKSKKETY